MLLTLGIHVHVEVVCSWTSAAALLFVLSDMPIVRDEWSFKVKSGKNFFNLNAKRLLLHNVKNLMGKTSYGLKWSSNTINDLKSIKLESVFRVIQTYD